MKASIFMVAALSGGGTPALAESVTGTVFAHGGHLVAISPQLPDGSLSTADNERAHLRRPERHRQRGRTTLRPYLRTARRAARGANDNALPAINGNESWALPLPATNVVARNGRIAFAYLDVDYRKRLALEVIVAGLRFAEV